MCGVTLKDKIKKQKGISRQNYDTILLAKYRHNILVLFVYNVKIFLISVPLSTKFYISPLHFSDNFISDNNKFTHVWHSPLVPGPGNQELVLLLSSEPKKSNSYQAFPRTTWKLITCGEI